MQNAGREIFTQRWGIPSDMQNAKSLSRVSGQLHQGAENTIQPMINEKWKARPRELFDLLLSVPPSVQQRTYHQGGLDKIEVDKWSSDEVIHGVLLCASQYPRSRCCIRRQPHLMLVAEMPRLPDRWRKRMTMCALTPRGLSLLGSLFLGSHVVVDVIKMAKCTHA